MKKLFSGLSILILSITPLFAQDVSNVNFKQVDYQIEITYDLSGQKFYQEFNVAVYVSQDGGQTFTGPLEYVTGAVGDSIKEGLNKKIFWDVLDEMPDISGQIVFDIRAVVFEKKPKSKVYLGYNLTPSAPIGFKFGGTGATGVYISTRFSQDYFNTYEFSAIVDDQNTGIIGDFANRRPGRYYDYTGITRNQRLSITGGLSFQVFWYTYIYFGLGYAQRNLLWEIDEREYSTDASVQQSWVKVINPYTFENFEAEGGVQVIYKYFYVSLGITVPGIGTPGQTFAEANISFGLSY